MERALRVRVQRFTEEYKPDLRRGTSKMSRDQNNRFTVFIVRGGDHTYFGSTRICTMKMQKKMRQAQVT